MMKFKILAGFLTAAVVSSTSIAQTPPADVLIGGVAVPTAVVVAGVILAVAVVANANSSTTATATATATGP